MTSDAKRPEWLVPGAEVVLYSSGRYPHVVRSTVAKVNKATFTVTAEREPRFRIRGCRASTGGTWGEIRYAVPRDSDEAASQLQGARERRLKSQARNAVETWQMDPSKETRVALVAALEALDGWD